MHSHKYSQSHSYFSRHSVMDWSVVALNQWVLEWVGLDSKYCIIVYSSRVISCTVFVILLDVIGGHTYYGINKQVTSSLQNTTVFFYIKSNGSAGMPMADKERNAPLHYTWEQSSYLATRREELADILKDIESFKPVSQWFCSST